ncbi:MAG: small multi-drug export protein [Deltaproteobacteria bacterium]|nr:small multi-drug export protein [Deltaproteobacteria bacterium]
MSLLKLSSLIFAAYLAAGRSGSIATCLLSGISPLETLIIALLIDLIQLPVYGMIIEASVRHIALPKKFQAWLHKKSNKIEQKIQKKNFWNRLVRYRPLAIITVSTIPVRGFGVLSACILAVMLNFGRVTGTLLIMSGSLIGSILSVLILYYPARWFNGF